MKKHFIFFITIMLSFSFYAQNSFKRGYFIDNLNQKTTCFIKTVDWNNNPSEFKYKLSEQGQLQKATLKSVQEFGINGISKFVRLDVDIDRANENINKLSNQRNPIFAKETLFLKVLMEGKATLYEYLDHGLTRYFYTKENLKVEQLIFKSYKIGKDKIAENNMFRQQLLDLLDCTALKINDFKNLDYNKNDLIQIFTKYNQCFNNHITYVEEKLPQNYFNLHIRPRVRNSTLTIVNAAFNDRDVIDFNNTTSIGVGLEAEIILPINKNKWTLLIEPTYQSYKAETVNNDVSVILGGQINSKVNYSSFEISTGLRHYFFLNKNSNMFVNASYVIDLDSNSYYEFTRSDSSKTYSVDFKTVQNVAFGVGYKAKNKYSVEIRYQTSRELMKHNTLWSSDFKTLSVIFGYTIF